MLFDSFTLKGNLIRNRIVMSPMDSHNSNFSGYAHRAYPLQSYAG